MAKGGSAPTYDPNAASESQIRNATHQAKLDQYGMESPFGDVTWQGEIGSPERRMIVDSPLLEQQAGLQGQALTGAEQLLPYLDTQYGSEAAKRAEESVMGQFESMYEPKFERDKAALAARLSDQGIPVGSEAHSRAMSDLDLSQGRLSQEAMNRSVLGGQQAQTQQLANALSLYGGLAGQNIQSPMSQYQPGIGSYQMQDPYNMGYQGAMQGYGIQQQAGSSMLGSIGGLAGAGMLALAM